MNKKDIRMNYEKRELQCYEKIYEKICLSIKILFVNILFIAQCFMIMLAYKCGRVRDCVSFLLCYRFPKRIVGKSLLSYTWWILDP